MNNNLLPQFKNNMPAVTPAVYTRYTKEELEEIINKNYGIVTVICSILDCNYKQFYKALDHYQIRDVLNDAKQQLVSLAEKAVLDCLTSEMDSVKLKAAEITLKSLGKTNGWIGDQTIINQQINVSDKQAEINNIFGI